jgi:hypothetical protein
MSERHLQDAAGELANARRMRLAVGICILMVLFWMLLDSLERQAIQAQQQGARLVLNQIRSMLVVKGAEVRLNGRIDYGDQAGANPFEWFESPPAGYGGICPGGKPTDGQWCFKPLPAGNNGYKKARQGGPGKVIFRPNQPITLENRPGSREAPLAWVVGIEFQDRNGNGRLDSDETRSGLKLDPTGVTQASGTEQQ